MKTANDGYGEPPRRDRSSRLQPQAGKAPCGFRLVTVFSRRSVPLCETVTEGERPACCRKGQA
jgi:hypothetical protein